MSHILYLEQTLFSFTVTIIVRLITFTGIETNVNQFNYWCEVSYKIHKGQVNKRHQRE